MKKDYISSFIPFYCILTGFLLGFLLNKLFYIQVDTKIRFFEIVNLLTTILIGFFIGYILKNRFENDKSIKTILIDDLKSVLIEINELSDYLKSLSSTTAFNEIQRNEIISRLNKIDKKINIFLKLLEYNCDTSSSLYIDTKRAIIKQFNNLNAKVTDDNLYNDEITRDYFDDSYGHISEFEISIKKIITDLISKL